MERTLSRSLHWNPEATDVLGGALDFLNRGGSAIVSPTKVGYIIMTTDRAGLDRKFELKQRPARKPGVVLCSSVEQVAELAQTTEDILKLYRNCYTKDILLGCILPWQEYAAKQHIPEDGSIELVQDPRRTSCFVVRFGMPSEQICSQMWNAYGKLVFASSANPSGTGNRGRLEGVGERILQGVDLIIEADDYVKSQQPDKTDEDRWAQGVMVSFVDDGGKIHDKAPKIIRYGLGLDRIEKSSLKCS